MQKSQTLKKSIATLTAATLIMTALSGCMVSENPVVNAVATSAAVGAASLLFYSINDGYYYDSDYNRMPRNYRPDSRVRIQRINSMDEYRQQHPRNNMQNRRQAPPQQQMQQRGGNWQNQQQNQRNGYPQRQQQYDDRYNNYY